MDQRGNTYREASMYGMYVASTGEQSPPIWFPEAFWLGAEAYIKALKETLIPWMRRVAASRGSLSCPAPFFQQDSAPAHRAKKTLEFLNSEKVIFYPRTVTAKLSGTESRGL